MQKCSKLRNWGFSEPIVVESKLLATDGLSIMGCAQGSQVFDCLRGSSSLLERVSSRYSPTLHIAAD